MRSSRLLTLFFAPSSWKTLRRRRAKDRGDLFGVHTPIQKVSLERVFRSGLVNKIERKANNRDSGNAENQNDRDESSKVFPVELANPSPKIDVQRLHDDPHFAMF